MINIRTLKRAHGLARSKLLLAECRRVKLNHSQPYIFDETNHGFIIYELNQRTVAKAELELFAGPLPLPDDVDDNKSSDEARKKALKLIECIKKGEDIVNTLSFAYGQNGCVDWGFNSLNGGPVYFVSIQDTICYSFTYNEDKTELKDVSFDFLRIKEENKVLGSAFLEWYFNDTEQCEIFCRNRLVESHFNRGDVEYGLSDMWAETQEIPSDLILGWDKPHTLINKDDFAIEFYPNL